MTIGALARAARTVPSLVRYYERRGVLAAPPRRSGARCYDRAALERLRSILVARRLGLSLDEIRAVLDGRSSLRDVAEARIALLDDTIRKSRVQRTLLRHASKRGELAAERYGRMLASIGA
ncbi:MAG: MerR family transcriptional regulator [Vulcanimicrobiaceae bacterium]